MADPSEGVWPDGTVRTGASRAHIDAVYQPALDAARTAVARCDRSVSLYLYGSVATGSAVVPNSDIDLLGIGLDPDDASTLAARLSDDFATLCRAVELVPTSVDDLTGDHDEAYGNRAFLRHYCVHLGGPEQHLGPAAFPADIRAARGFNGDIDQHLTRWTASLRDGAPPELLGRRAARKTLLALAGLVSIVDGIWTTDREIAAARWTDRHPETEADLRDLSAWACGSRRPSGLQLASALDGARRTIAEEFRSTIGLWDSRRP